MHPSAVQNFKATWAAIFIVLNALFWLYLKVQIESYERLFLLHSRPTEAAIQRQVPRAFLPSTPSMGMATFCESRHS